MEWYRILGTEILGTALLILLGNGIVANTILKGTKGNDGKTGWLAITMGWGFAVTVAAYVATALKGAGHFNPAVTLAFAISDWDGLFGSEPWKLAIFIGGQFIGAIIGQIICDLIYIKHITQTLGESEDNKGLILGMHATGPQSKNVFVNFLSEMVGTIVLVIVVLCFSKYALSSSANTYAPMLNPIIVGITITGIGLAIGGTTGFAINPARDLAPRIVHQLLPIKGKGSSDWGYSWIPVVAPLAGAAIVGVCLLI